MHDDSVHRDGLSFSKFMSGRVGYLIDFKRGSMLEERLADFRVSLTDSADWVGRQLKRLTSTMYQDKLLTADHLIEFHAK